MSGPDGLDGTEYDHAVAAVELSWPLHIGFRDGLRSPLGSISRIAVEKYFGQADAPADSFPGLTAEIKQCVYLKNEKRHDDEEEDDEEEEAVDLQIHPVNKLICGFVGQANQKIANKLPTLSISDFTQTPPDSRLNVWQSGYMLEKSPQLSCMGLQPIGPVRFDFDNRGLFVASAFIDVET
jgi:hypothetical protein